MSSARPSYSIDPRYRAKSCDERIKFLVLHYTAGSFETSLDTLTNGEVSAHYLVPDKMVGADENVIYNLVDENRRAYHAGVSYWRGRTSLNDTSIGIEIVNLGYTDDASGKRTWYPFTDYQIDLVIGVSKDIIARYGIDPICVVGHNDIAPGRKPDPGPLFPWEKLAKNGIGAWPDADVAREIQGKLNDDVDINALQASLKKYGYNIQTTGELDQQTKDVITAFNRHFISIDSDEPSLKMRATLEALIVKYLPSKKIVSQAKQEKKLLNEEVDDFVWVSHSDTRLAPKLFRPSVTTHAQTQTQHSDHRISASPMAN